MTQVSESVKKFFEGVEQASNTLHLELISSQYADTFMFGDPSGARVIEKQKFLTVLPKRQEFFKSFGHKTTQVVSLDETRLDDHYVMVRAHFRMHFEKASTQSVDANLASTFILYIKDAVPQIVMHIEDEFLEAAMQRLGLLPAKA